MAFYEYLYIKDQNVLTLGSGSQLRPFLILCLYIGREYFNRVVINKSHYQLFLILSKGSEQVSLSVVSKLSEQVAQNRNAIQSTVYLSMIITWCVGTPFKQAYVPKFSL